MPRVIVLRHRRGPARRRLAVGLLSLCVLSVACGTFDPSRRGSEMEPVRVSEATEKGDPARRASIRLVLQGLDADIEGRPRRAQGSYERAIQVDPTNPYAYLALARHHLDGHEAERASALLDQAAALFEAEGMRDPRVGVHLMGLRGRGLEATGRSADGIIYLDRAAELAPGVWGDGYLGPEELR